MKIVVPVLALAGLVRAVSITGCHQHGTDVYCITESGEEVQVALDNPPAELPSEYTDCHTHGDKSYCVDPNGEDVEVLGEVTSSGTNSEDSNSQSNEESSGGENCHFHAGVEHCVGAGESESDSNSSESSEGQNCHFHAGVEHCVGAGESESGGSSSSCGIRSRDYDMPLRIGTLFVILVTSSIGVFLPMALAKLPSARINVWVSTIIKQFGTGVILSTAFVHLYTHADLMFSNECLGELEYEATTSAVVMAGIFLSFLTEYIGHRYILARSARSGDSSPQRVDNDSSKSAAEQAPAQQIHQHSALAGLGHHHGGDPTNPNTKLSVLVMEAGVIFHSILIGITLVVAGDSFYKTLLVVIVFHQFFEGLALGARIALLPGRTFPMKAIMGAAFALVTPVGMAIGMGVIHSFNGQDRHTLIALGTLDALSAGILVWVGLVDMWARDWVIEGGDMFAAPLRHVAAGGISLIAGMVLMGVLGKWA